MISTVERVLFLKSVDLFREIPGEELARVAMIATEVDFEVRSSLMEEEALGTSMFLIISGRVSVRKGSAQVTELGPRECVGELSILDSEPRSATVIAIEPTRALCLEGEDFFELLAERREIAQGVIRVLCRRLRNTTARRP